MIKLYVVSMFFLPVLDAFDRLYERFGVNVPQHSMIPDGWFVFGTLVDTMVRPGVRRNLRFVSVKLPITTWGFRGIAFDYGWITHYLTWVEGSPRPFAKSFCGWSVWPPLNYGN